MALWGAWWPPFAAIRRLVLTEAFRWSEFAADLAAVLSVAAVAVVLLLAWGVFGEPAGPDPAGAGFGHGVSLRCDTARVALVRQPLMRAGGPGLAGFLPDGDHGLSEGRGPTSDTSARAEG